MSEQKFLHPHTFREHLRAFLLAFILVLLPLLLLEGLLRIFDPWGIYFFDDMAKMANDFEPNAQRIYYLPDGVYKYSHWTATIENGSRKLPPANADSHCEIVLLGDSFTFGYGVNDDETWAYHLAQAFPDVTFVNTGITAYNSEHVRRTYELYPDADAFLYTVIYNDWEPTANYAANNDNENPAKSMPYIVRYGNFFLYRSHETNTTQYTPEELVTIPDMQRFLSDIKILKEDSRVELLGFKDTLTSLAMIGAGYDFYPLDYPHYPISFSDGHLNAEGHRVFAEELQPIVQEIIDKHCS